MFSNQTSRVYCDIDDLHGGVRVLMDESGGREGDQAAMCVGAAIALDIMASTDRLQYPRDFLTVFKARAFEEYTKDNKED